MGIIVVAPKETWLIRTALDFLEEVKQGFDRENVIQRTSGNIYQSLRLDYVNMKLSKTLQLLFMMSFIKRMGRNFQTKIEKSWIYQFAFVYKEKCIQKIDESIANKIVEKLNAEGKKITEENIN